MKTTTKFKGMLGASKMKSLFQQRSKALTNVLNQVITLIESDPVFKSARVDSRQRIQKGLENLRNEEWISINDVQTLNALLKIQ
jgi:hypothetical protein